MRLTLTSERLAELTAVELSGVGGGAYEMTPSCPLVLKLSDLLNCHTA
jgi:hypothetical protein